MFPATLGALFLPLWSWSVELILLALSQWDVYISPSSLGPDRQGRSKGCFYKLMFLRALSVPPLYWWPFNALNLIVVTVVILLITECEYCSQYTPFPKLFQALPPTATLYSIIPIGSLAPLLEVSTIIIFFLELKKPRWEEASHDFDPCG